MTRLATLSRVIRIGLCFGLGAAMPFGCSGSSQARGSGSGGTPAVAIGGNGNSAGGTAAAAGSTRAAGGASAPAGGTAQAAETGGVNSLATGTNADSAPSPGCNATHTPASGRFSIDVNGTTREYIIDLPQDYDPKHAYRLILAFHGRQYSAESVASGGPPGSGPYYGIQSEANGDAIFVAPQALASSWMSDSAQDLAFVSAMLNHFETELCVDQRRIFATGFSMGAIMTIAIGCAQADVFRAIAPMSGSLQGTCSGSHPIAYWASHGTNDTTIPIANGEAARNAFVTRNGCSATGTTAGAPDGCVNYTGCDQGYPTTWCTFDGVHEPPPFAGQAIWAFFAQF